MPVPRGFPCPAAGRERMAPNLDFGFLFEDVHMNGALPLLPAAAARFAGRGPAGGRRAPRFMRTRERPHENRKHR